MFMGNKIFTFDKGELQLHFNPKLPGWMFDEEGIVSFTLFSKCKVTYHNPSRKSTFGAMPARISSIVIPEIHQEFEGNYLRGALAEKVRNGEITNIIIPMTE
jgi:hypothetical protein